MKNFAVAYGMARRSKGMYTSAAVEPKSEAEEQDMIKAIMARRQTALDAELNDSPEEEHDLSPELDEVAEPAPNRREMLSRIMGR